STWPSASQRLTPPSELLMLPDRSRSKDTSGRTGSNSTSPSMHSGGSSTGLSGSVSSGFKTMLEPAMQRPSSVHSSVEMQSSSSLQSAAHTPERQWRPAPQGASSLQSSSQPAMTKSPQAEAGSSSGSSSGCISGGLPPLPSAAPPSAGGEQLTTESAAAESKNGK